MQKKTKTFWKVLDFLCQSNYMHRAKLCVVWYSHIAYCIQTQLLQDENHGMLVSCHHCQFLNWQCIIRGWYSSFTSTAPALALGEDGPRMLHQRALENSDNKVRRGPWRPRPPSSALPQPEQDLASSLRALRKGEERWGREKREGWRKKMELICGFHM